MTHYIVKDWRGSGKASLLFSLFISLLIPQTALASLFDYDLDNDGLIEINNLADLYEIRNHLDGSARNGCPADGCKGFELTTDLDFDTNQDGFMDENDDYWNSGEGWLPIGDDSNPFTAIFEGNGHVIKNLTINRPSMWYVGLFGYIDNAQVRQLGLTGPLMSVAGSYYVGALAGLANENNTISAIYNTGAISGLNGNVGGLIGRVNDNNQIGTSFNTGSVTSPSSYVGGLVGLANSNNQINDSYSSGYVSGGLDNVGGLIGIAIYSNNVISNSYWALDSSGQATSDDSSESSGYVGLTLATLQCAINANSDASISSCVSNDGSEEGLDKALTLYAGWEVSGYWDFGNNQQLPGLILNGVMHRDSDGDGSLDEHDTWQNQSAASLDQDNDGHPDSWTLGCDDTCIADSGLTLDQFPSSVTAWQDNDLDGLVDAWADDCDVICQNDSGLTLDAYLDDTDNDGIANANDNDDNNDDLTDVDADSDGLIEVSTLAQLNAIRYQLDGAGYRASTNADLDQSGCPAILYQGRYQQRCSGYELLNDLDFDTNQDGLIDANDDYWDTGSGWSPIGNSSKLFMGIFEGNGHVISNLYINRPSSYYIGLFSQINHAQIHQVGLTGPLMSLVGSNYVGALVGKAHNNNIISASYNTGSVTATYSDVGGLVGSINEGNQITASYNTGSVAGKSDVGGLVGEATDGNQISASYNTGSVAGSFYNAGGLVGSFDSNNQITDSYSSGYVGGTFEQGGLVGSYYGSNVITNSYWATDSSGQVGSGYSSESTGSLGLTLATLQCAIEANTDSANSSCVSVDGGEEGLSAALTLYAGWQASGYWDFGDNQQLPGLILNSVVHRDSDGDGSLDGSDRWPNQRAAALDQDGDDYPDNWTQGCDALCIELSGLIIDQFPTSAAAGQDSDLDGLVDAWADDCDATCQNDSGLTLDIYLDDTDNDSISNSEDTDDNNDGVKDVDADSDGLIEISTLTQLNSVRHQLDGSGYRASSDAELDKSGCPVVVYQGVEQLRCTGYELLNNLDFDTNQDGVMDVNDDYWNANDEGVGEGWMPIGSSYSNMFTGTFEGNGYVINNLYINRPNSDYVGLFGYIQHAQIHQLGLSGVLMSVTGDGYVGALVGRARDNNGISAVYNTGPVTGSSAYVGGLVGGVDDNNLISTTYNTGSITSSSYYQGGLVGSISKNNQIIASYSTGYVSGTTRGGLIGDVPSSYENLISNSYWATDSSGQGGSSGSSETTGYVGLTLDTLLCAIKANTNASNSACVSEGGSDEGLSDGFTLYTDWDISGYWDFGNGQQLPSLTLNSALHPDSDGDGVLNDYDAFPSQWAASVDQDNDGYPDSVTAGCDKMCIEKSGLMIDQFPFLAAASLDNDLDGLVDAWADDCDSACQSDSGLTLDTYLDDADNDGLNTVEDNDDNSDGIIDVDADSDGLIEVRTLAQLDAMRFQLDGAGYRASSEGELDQSGCPVTIQQGRFQQSCFGYELSNDLDFDTNQDGVIDTNDDYWHEGEGWSPIGVESMENSSQFTGIFEGNGHVIYNLYINRPNGNGVGLFGSISNAKIHQLGLTGPLMSVTGAISVGALVGSASENNILTAIYNTGAVEGSSYSVGGLVGNAMTNNQISSSYNTGPVSGSAQFVGGLVGFIYESNQISASYSSGYVQGGSGIGGLIGASEFSSSSNLINNSYWATDNSGQPNSHESSEDSGYVGLTLATLQCASEANTNASNSSCVSADGASEGLNAALTLYKDWQVSGYWDFGDDQQLPSLILNGVVHRDSDKDGVLDVNDAFYLNPAASVDDDEDGQPDAWAESCDIQCQQESGLEIDPSLHDTDNDLVINSEDTDDDNDGVLDINDEYRLISLNGNADFDGDGIPDSCEQACVGSGMAADTDDDNDGVQDINDEYRLISLNGNADFDGDGIPDECDQACIDSGMAFDTDIDNDGVLNVDDAFDFDANESSDYDSDTIGDNADTDDDNDGVIDEDDAELGADNGAPELLTVADDAFVSVTTENGFNALVTIDDDYMLAFVATDMVDSDLRFEASLNGNVLSKDDNDQVLLPAGNLNIIWVAIDDAGNRSNSLTQNVKVYPRVSFTLVESIIGEASDALIEVKLSGESPVYPVTIELEIDALSEIDQNDLSDSFDISAKHHVIIEQGDDENAPNLSGSLVIPVVDDGVNENDELLVVNLNGVIVAEDEENFYLVDETLNQHTLTITYQNLAPVIQLLMEQAGVEVANVKQDGGDVTVTALITDGNGNDTHTFAWDLNSLGLSVPLGNVLTFSPANLAVGEYALSVEATDDGINPLSGSAVLNVNVTAPRATEPDDDAASAGSSGGGSLWWALLLLAGVSLQTKRRRVIH